MWCTAGADGYEKVRSLFYDGADIIIIAFSIADSHGEDFIPSFRNVTNKWKKEISQITKNPKVISRVSKYQGDHQKSPLGD